MTRNFINRIEGRRDEEVEERVSNRAEWLHDHIIVFKIHGIIKKIDQRPNRYFTKEDIQMVYKSMKRCSTSYDMKNINHTAMSYPHIPVSMAKIQSSDNTACW